MVANACNALVESETQDAEVAVETSASDDAVSMSFRDNGPGMGADVLARVFEPLYSTRRFGVGLGLPLVRQIAEQHGGEVRVSSEEGGGAEVVLVLPRANGEACR